MIEYLFKLAIEYFPQIAGYLCSAALLIIVVWKIASFYFKTNAAVQQMNDIGPLLSKISAGFTTLNTVLIEKNIISQSCYSQENSPRVLNDAGKKLLKESGAATLFDSLKEELIKDVEKQEIDSFLEAERSCLNALLEKMDDIRFRDIQNFAYQHPTFDGKALTYTDILFVMALELRDTYIQRHPEKLSSLK